MNTRSSIGAVATVTVISALVFVGVLVRAVWYAPDTELPAPPDINLSPATVASVSKPTRLLIPLLDIDADVQHVGINAGGAMRAPSNFRDVAWYKYGAVPGQKGSAVIAGHVDNGLALSGVFRRLDELRVGDDVYVLAEDGSKLHFIIEDMQAYPYTEAPGERIFTADDAAYLNLVTCAGSWIPGKQTYSKRLIIYTKFAGIIES